MDQYIPRISIDVLAKVDPPSNVFYYDVICPSYK